MAEALFKARLAQAGQVSGWSVASAGTWALEGHPPAELSQKVMQESGLDISHHRSHSVDQELLEGFDLILTMESGHKEALRAEFPEVSGRVYLLSEMAGRTHNIDDPIGRSVVEFRATVDEIESIIDAGFQKIQEFAREKPEK
jgi:protein-tyrosine phosphatase